MDMKKFRDLLTRAFEMEEVMAGRLAGLTALECLHVITDKKKKHFVLKTLLSIRRDTRRHHRIVKKILFQYKEAAVL
jgi:hypothetical protein